MSNYAPETYYRHRHGGIYKTICLSKSSVDRSDWVIYRHVYPFEELVWHRPLAEWTSDRFVELNEAACFRSSTAKIAKSLRLRSL